MVTVSKANYTTVNNAIEERTDELFNVMNKFSFVRVLSSTLFFIPRVGIFTAMVLYIKVILFNTAYRFVIIFEQKKSTGNWLMIQFYSFPSLVTTVL